MIQKYFTAYIKLFTPHDYYIILYFGYFYTIETDYIDGHFVLISPCDY